MLIIKKNEKSYRNKILKFKNFSFKKKLYRNLALCFSSALLFGVQPLYLLKGLFPQQAH